MNPILKLLGSSLGKKFLMALSGALVAGFVLGHMAGNLQFFLAPKWINAYAYHLQHMPYGLLWVVRAVMLSAIGVHILTALTLYKGNKDARPVDYDIQNTVQATLASRTMILSGLVLLAFIIFHILHYTVKLDIFNFDTLPNFVMEDGKEVHNVYAMMYLGFSKLWVSIFYIISVGLLAFHLSHGVTSMFQSLGLRNEIWRYRLDCFAKAYGIILFLGFAIIPVTVLLDFYGIIDIFDKESFKAAFEAAKLASRSCCAS